jgi:hypothetical protein
LTDNEQRQRAQDQASHRHRLSHSSRPEQEDDAKQIRPIAG